VHTCKNKGVVHTNAVASCKLATAWLTYKLSSTNQTIPRRCCKFATCNCFGFQAFFKLRNNSGICHSTQLYL
jgi:hypothetical protein